MTAGASLYYIHITRFQLNEGLMYRVSQML